MQNEFNDIRIFFTKTDMTKYISHLDLMRCMGRAIRRAGIPLWYTEGYNPHLFMTFARPLSLGQESLCECVDVRLVGEMTLKEVKQRLNDALPPGITIVSVAKPVHKAMEIASADYEITLRPDDVAELKACIEAHYAEPTIIVLKKAKQGRRKIEKEVDIKPNVLSFRLEQTDDALKLFLQLTAGIDNNINPSLLLSALEEGFPEEFVQTSILKTKIYIANGEVFS